MRRNRAALGAAAVVLLIAVLAIVAFAVGIGSPDGPRDREVLGISTGDPRLDHASVDLHVTAMSTGFGRQPFTLRVLGNEAAYFWRLMIGGMTIEIISVMTFDDDGKIASMKAYWGPDNITQS